MNTEPFLSLVMVLCVGGQTRLSTPLWGAELAPVFSPCCVDVAPKEAPPVRAHFDVDDGRKSSSHRSGPTIHSYLSRC